MPPELTDREVAEFFRRLAAVETEVSQLKTRVAELTQQIRSLDEDVASLRRGDEKRDEDRKADRRFNIGTAVAVISIVIAAMALIQQAGA